MDYGNILDDIIIIKCILKWVFIVRPCFFCATRGFKDLPKDRQTEHGMFRVCIFFIFLSFFLVTLSSCELLYACVVCQCVHYVRTVRPFHWCMNMDAEYNNFANSFSNEKLQQHFMFVLKQEEYEHERMIA